MEDRLETTVEILQIGVPDPMVEPLGQNVFKSSWGDRLQMTVEILQIGVSDPMVEPFSPPFRLRHRTIDFDR